MVFAPWFFISGFLSFQCISRFLASIVSLNARRVILTLVIIVLVLYCILLIVCCSCELFFLSLFIILCLMFNVH